MRLIYMYNLCFNTQPPEGGWSWDIGTHPFFRDVSTHSRLKAAGAIRVRALWRVSCFNTQPPEGGWQMNADTSNR